MAEVIICGQGDVLGGACPECGGWLHRVTRGGFPNRHGMRYCDEDCVAESQEQARRQHLRGRDLLCRCEVCVAAGHPTAAEIDEWEQELREIEGEADD